MQRIGQVREGCVAVSQFAGERRPRGSSGGGLRGTVLA